MSTYKIEIELPIDKVASVITREPYYGSPFFMLGQKRTYRGKTTGFDMSISMKNLSKSATWFFWTLTETRDPKTNIAILRSSALTKTERKRVSAGYKELHNKGVIKRIKKEYYLFHPEAVIPNPRKEQPAILLAWSKLP